MSSATCSGSAEQPANNSKDSSAEHMWSAVQPASLPDHAKPVATEKATEALPLLGVGPCGAATLIITFLPCSFTFTGE